MNKLLGVLITLIMTATATAELEIYGAWAHFKRIDPITDEDSSSLFGLVSEHPQYRDLAGLSIRCSQGSLSYGDIEVLFNTEASLGNHDVYEFIY